MKSRKKNLIQPPRITAGIFKGKKLLVPASARALTERIKISIFDTLTPVLSNSKCLDIFAGSGSYGFEALSRGATSVDFIDRDLQAVNLIKKNAENVGLNEEQYTVSKRNYSTFCQTTGSEYDLIFVDPPFPVFLKTKFLAIQRCLKIGGILVVRYPAEITELFFKLENFEILINRKIGRSGVLFAKKLYN